MGMHDGHRERMKRRFLEHGLDSFSDFEALEILLFYAVPRRNTNEMAHALMERFGSYRGVLEADFDELCTVPGIGENAATLIQLVKETDIRYRKSLRSEGKRLNNTEAAGEYIMPLFAYQKRETAYMLLLDVTGKLISSTELAKGIVNRVDISAREIIETAIKANAAKVILAHNHLSGTALPSDHDVSSTIGIYNALRTVEIELVDHIIVCDDDFVSMRDSGIIGKQL